MHASDAYAIPGVAAEATLDARTAFIRQTYAHLTGAIFAFAGVSWVLFQTGVAAKMVSVMTFHQWAPLLYFVGFMAVSWIARSWASRDTSRGMQYLGLGVYVVAQALFFVPLLYFAAAASGPGNNIIYTASIMTLTIFGGLTVFVFTTKKDFSFLRGFLVVASLVAFGFILCSMLFSFDYSMVFTIAMIALAAGDKTSPGLGIDGDAGVLESLFSVLDPGDPDFEIVLP